MATCSWIQSHETVLMLGPPGVGKTHLSVALGVRAIECGFSVGFYHLDDLLHDIKKDAEGYGPSAPRPYRQHACCGEHQPPASA